MVCDPPSLGRTSEVVVRVKQSWREDISGVTLTKEAGGGHDADAVSRPVTLRRT
jgi:hypothetical protein